MERSDVYVATVLGLGFFSDGFALLLQSGALISLVHYFYLSKLEVGLVVSAPFIGSIAGAFIFGRLADILGRKAVVLNVLVFFVLASLLSAASINFQMLWISRLLVGIGIGGDVPSTGSLVYELAKRHSGSALLSYQNMLWGVGAFIATVIAIPFIGFGNAAWRFLFALAAVPPLITLVLRRGLQESEQWLRSRDAQGQAIDGKTYAYFVLLSAALFSWTYLLAALASYAPSILVNVFGLPSSYSLLISGSQWLLFVAGVALVTLAVRSKGLAIGASITSVIIFALSTAMLTAHRLGAYEFIWFSTAFWLLGGVGYTSVSITSFADAPVAHRGTLSGLVFALGRFGGYVSTQSLPLLIGSVGIAGGLFVVSPALVASSLLAYYLRHRSLRFGKH